MNTIKYKGTDYPVRVFMVTNDEYPMPTEITIGTESLQKILDYDGDDAHIDNAIYYYVPDDVIELSPYEICKEHLDVRFIFVKEIL